MNRLKILFTGLMIVSFLIIGQPSAIMAKAADAFPEMPVIVFAQYKNDKMLLKHNFGNDSKIYINVDNYEDSGFYINIPANK